jgi:hypothetical protein
MTTILDLQPESEQIVENKADSKETVSQNTVSTSADDDEKSNSANKSKDTIVLDGPLSTIYTQALQIAYSKKAIDAEHESDMTSAVEKMAIDASMMGVMEVIDETERGSAKPLYVYVTDDEHLGDGATGEVFDTLRVSAESGRYSGVWFCTEDGYKLGRSQVLLSDFVLGCGGRVYYSKESLWRALGV